MLKGFRDFNLRGNVVQVAVGVIVGLTFCNLFSDLVHATVNDLLNPVFFIVVGKLDFSTVVVTLNGTRINIGSFLNAVVSTCFLSFMLFLLVVLPLNSLMVRLNKPAPDEPPDVRPDESPSN